MDELLALNAVLNNLNMRVYITNYGVAPTSNDRVIGFTEVNEPKTLRSDIEELYPVELDGFAIKQLITRNVENVSLVVPHIDKDTIKRLNGYAFSRVHLDLYIIDELDSSNNFYVTVNMVGSKENDISAKTLKQTTYEFAVSGRPKTFNGTIE